MSDKRDLYNDEISRLSNEVETGKLNVRDAMFQLVGYIYEKDSQLTNKVIGSDLYSLSSLYRRVHTLMDREQQKSWEARITLLLQENGNMQHKIEIAIIELCDEWSNLLTGKYDDKNDTISLSEELRQDQWTMPDGTVMSNKFGNPLEVEDD